MAQHARAAAPCPACLLQKFSCGRHASQPAIGHPYTCLASYQATHLHALLAQHLFRVLRHVWRDGQQPCARDRQVPHHSGIGKHVWVVDDNQVALRQVQGQDLPAVLREGTVGSGGVCSRMDGSPVALAVPGAEQLCLHCLGPK